MGEIFVGGIFTQKGGNLTPRPPLHEWRGGARDLVAGVARGRGGGRDVIPVSSSESLRDGCFGLWAGCWGLLGVGGWNFLTAAVYQGG